jgi:hypothetical protein
MARPSRNMQHNGTTLEYNDVVGKKKIYIYIYCGVSVFIFIVFTITQWDYPN